MSTLPRFVIIAAAIGGVAWIIKVTTITVRDAYFDPLESVFYLTGLLGIVIATAGLGWHLAARFNVVARVAAAFGAVVGMVVISVIVAGAVAAVYNGGNLGIEMEMGLFVVAAGWLAVAARALLAERVVPAKLAAKR